MELVKVEATVKSGCEDPVRRAHASVSVVVLTYNRRAEVLATVAQLRLLPERPAIIVVDNGSTDATADVLERTFPDISVVRCLKNLGAAGRNEGVKTVRTEYVAFSDDDTHWQPGSLTTAARLLDAYKEVDVLNARVLVVQAGEQGVDEHVDPTCKLMAASPIRTPSFPGPGLIGFMAGACVFRTEGFLRCGGYCRKLFIGGEESLLSMDVLASGQAIAYCAEMTVSHAPSPFRDARHRRILIARNSAWVGWLRLPWKEAWQRTISAFEVFQAERQPVSAYVDLCSGLAWALRHRKRLPDAVLSLRAHVQRAEREGQANISALSEELDSTAESESFVP